MTDEPFDVLYARLHRRARRLVNCPDEAADLAQDAAMKVWQRVRNGAPIANRQAYAMTTLANLARSRWRSRRINDVLDEDTVSTPPDAPRRIACAELRAALARLPRAQADLMALVAEGETSPAELARLTGVPTGTVMSRLARARARLRGDLGIGKTGPCAALYDETAG